MAYVRAYDTNGNKVRIREDAVDQYLNKGFKLADESSPKLNTEQQPPQKAPSAWDFMAGTFGLAPTANAAIGGVNALTRQGTDVLNLANKLNPMSLGDVEAPHIEPLTGDTSGIAYNLGNIAGNIGGFGAGGSALNMGRKALESAPSFIGQAARALGGEGISGIARRAVGAGLYGAAENPNNMMTGALAGAGLSAVPEGAVSAIKEIGKRFGPTRAAQKLAENIKNIYESNIGKVSKIFEPLMNDFAPRKIYEMQQKLNFSKGKNKLRGDIEESLPDSSSFGSLKEKYVKKFGPEIEEMAEQFKKDPTFESAHHFQSQLGHKIRNLQKSKNSGTLSPEGGHELFAYKKARDALKDDISKFLQKQSPEKAEQYKYGLSEYARTVAPFSRNKQISHLATGEIEEPENIKLLVKEMKKKKNKYLNSVIGDDIRSLQHKKALPDLLSKVASPITHTLGINKLAGPLAQFASNSSPKIYDVLRQSLLSNILANRGNQ